MAQDWVAGSVREGLLAHAGEETEVPGTGSGDPDQWPWPTRRTETRAPYALEKAVRARLDLPYGVGQVTIVEDVVSDGYSEYTTEDHYDHEVRVDGRTVWSTEENYEPWTGIRKLIEWLEEV